MDLNLGCGDHLAPYPWHNVDFGSPHARDETVDLRGPLPWPPGSVQHAYLGHVLEHLPLPDVLALLQRLRPCMAENGLVMVVGPDVVRGRAQYSAGLIPVELWEVMQAGAGGRRWPGDEHFWDCEPVLLRKLLAEAGWQDVAEIPIGGVHGFWPVVAPVDWQCAVTARAGEGAPPDMCHASVLSYVAEILAPQDVAGKWVLDVGSYDVNGTARSVLASMRPEVYLGVDASAGPGVDEVVQCEALAAWAGGTCFDVVISTEMLEHVRDWSACLSNMMEVVADGGLLVLTTRAPGFPFHPFPEDHWRYPPPVMRTLLASAGFDVLDCRPDPDPASPGVLAMARRPAGWRLPPTAAKAWAAAGVLPV